MMLSALSLHDMWPFIAVGFAAQLVDSALGAAFGVITNALLVMLGLPPVMASATTRGVESFTTAASGIAHVLQRNVDWRLFARLVVPGIVGALVGGWLLLLVRGDVLRPVLMVYLIAVGAYLLWRAPRRPQTFRRMRLVGPLGLLGGLFDASGSGGWGPLVTGNLLAQGMTPRMAIGTVNAAEFFVTVTVLAVFIGSVSLETFAEAAAGILIGGIVAAPLGAWLTRRVAPSALLKLVGVLLIAVGAWTLVSLMIGRIPMIPGE